MTARGKYEVFIPRAEFARRHLGGRRDPNSSFPPTGPWDPGWAPLPFTLEDRRRGHLTEESIPLMTLLSRRDVSSVATRQ